RDHLARLGIVAEARRVRHPDEFVLDDRLCELERRRNDASQRVRIGAIGDDEEFAIDEPIGSRRKRRARERHRESTFSYFGFGHGNLLLSRVAAIVTWSGRRCACQRRPRRASANRTFRRPGARPRDPPPTARSRWFGKIRSPSTVPSTS